MSAKNAIKALLIKGYQISDGEVKIGTIEDGSYFVRNGSEDDTFKKAGKAVRCFMEKRREAAANGEAPGGERDEERAAAKKSAPKAKKKPGKKPKKKN